VALLVFHAQEITHLLLAKVWAFRARWLAQEITHLRQIRAWLVQGLPAKVAQVHQVPAQVPHVRQVPAEQVPAQVAHAQLVARASVALAQAAVLVVQDLAHRARVVAQDAAVAVPALPVPSVRAAAVTPAKRASQSGRNAKSSNSAPHRALVERLFLAETAPQ
jgi:hypothetical protein